MALTLPILTKDYYYTDNHYLNSVNLILFTSKGRSEVKTLIFLKIICISGKFPLLSVNLSSVKSLFLRSARRSLQTFLFLFCFFFLRSADYVGRPFCFCSVSYYFFYSFFFFFTAICVPRFLPYFSTNLDEIWHVDSTWWDEEMLEISSQ